MSFPGTAIGDQADAGLGPFTGNERLPITGSRALSLNGLRVGYLNEFYILDALSNLPGGPLILDAFGFMDPNTQMDVDSIRANKLKLSAYFWENGAQQLDYVDLSIAASQLDNDSGVAGVSVKDALDSLAAQISGISMPIVIDSFVLNPATYTYEIGSAVASTTVEWEISFVTLSTCTLTLPGGGTVDVTATTISGSGTGSYFYNVPMSGSTKTFVITADDGTNPPVAQSLYVRFYPRIHWGVELIEPSPDSAFILGLASSSLQNNASRTFTVSPGADQYIYFAYPDSFGDVTFWVGGFEGGFTLVDTVSHTNASGHTQNYRVYRSVNPNLGGTTVSVVD